MTVFQTRSWHNEPLCEHRRASFKCNPMKFSSAIRAGNNNNHIHLEPDFTFQGPWGLNWEVAESNLWIDTVDHLTDRGGSVVHREFLPGRTLNSLISGSSVSLSLKTTVRSQTGWKSQVTVEKLWSSTSVFVHLILCSFYVVFIHSKLDNIPLEVLYNVGLYNLVECI